MRQVLYKHEGQTSLKVLDKSKSSVNLPLPKDNGYAVLEIRSWGEGGDGPAHEIIVSGDSGKTEKRRKNQSECCHGCGLTGSTGQCLSSAVELLCIVLRPHLSAETPAFPRWLFFVL